MSLNNSQYNALMRMYDERQARNRAAKRAREDEIRKELPEIPALEEEMGRLSVAQVEARLTGGLTDAAKNAYHEQMNELRTKKAKLLADAGYPADYLELHYECEDCKDTGFVDGKHCHCFLKASLALRYEQSGMAEVLEKENFSTLKSSVYDNQTIIPELGCTVRAHMRRVVRECTSYVANFEKNHGSLLFMGQPGTGKTFLTHCIAKALLDNGCSVLSFSSGHLSSLFSRQINNRDDEELQSLDETLVQVDLLILDDLGTEFGNLLDSTKLFYLINQRLLLNKATIISTNLPMDVITERYSERVTSRLFSEYKVIQFFGDDIRRKSAHRA